MIVKPHITENDVVSVVACISGTATPQQAKAAMDWIMLEAARVPDLSYQEDDPTATKMAFAEGRRYVGHLIRQMLLPETHNAAKAAAARGKP